MATATPMPEQIPLINSPTSGNNNTTSSNPANPHTPEPAHLNRDAANTDLEGGPAAAGEEEEANAAADAEALPAYKEHDMEEPLPPYMARFKRVMQGQEPMSTIMPNRRGGIIVMASFAVVVIIIVGVAVGVTVGGNKNNNNNNNNSQ